MHSARTLATAIGDCGVVASNSLIYGIPPFDATPTTSVLIISPSTTTATAAVTAAVDETTTINSLQAGVTTDRSTNTADTTMLGELQHGGCKWISGVAADNGLFLPRHSMQLAIHPHRRSSRNEFHHRDGLDVSMPLFSMVTFIHTGAVTRFAHTHTGNTSSSTDALSSLLILMPCATTSPSCTTTGTLCWCARAGGLAKSAWAVRGKVGYDPSCKQAEEEFNKYTYTELALETKFGLIVEGFGYHPLMRACVRACPYQDLLDWETFSIRIPRAQAPRGVLPRVLRSTPDEVVGMMQRRVVFVFEEFFKSLSTQVHTALESARINLFSGENAWQRAL
ncbi:hypothetical protein PTSG_11281 [Salpingoeca rosetta]|uniref:Exostosin GT47 domain-containing protein n=1 Tax=Salpingoeca rosetta (strain ATCC 50818 / BSB-021) TaxID=946362 RepID=F2USY6_SALR5|nr:uncharacterized protein PTSG_11281 [Salpingoeca rosetta]EGD81245.1 hypothetical protein PTSG_11281 [Salpingoeca rosetta]|eukprot:XP_004987779.1 hypothetical protein PTSG_11281 [Salpingoeca rosetta]